LWSRQQFHLAQQALQHRAEGYKQEWKSSIVLLVTADWIENRESKRLS
jgi:hypothetical protein